jgi:hypothetical protein
VTAFYDSEGFADVTAGFEGFVGARMDVSAVFEVEREFGTFYQGWEDEHNMNDDCVILDDEEDIDGAVQATVTESPELAASPTQTNFHSASSKDSSNNVISPRRRRSSLSAILNPVTMGVPAVVPAAPLPSARLRGHSQIPGPSPLAQLFVRPPDERRPMLPVGSMPVTSSFLSGLSGSPRRTRPSFGATGSSMSAGGGPGTSGISVSLSTSSLASAPSAAGGAGGGSRALVRPSITPIQEDPTSLSSSVADLGEWAPSQSAPATSTTTTSPTASNSPTQRAKKPETHFPTDASSSTGDVSSSNITSPVTLGVGRRRAASADSTSTVSPMTASLQLPPPTIVEPLNEDKEKKSERRPPTSDRSERSERSERSDRPDRPESKKDRDREKLGRGGGTGAVPSPRIKPSTSGSVPGLKASAACKMPKTASELLESLEAAGAADQDAAANVATIAKIAERQARIEALLEQLLAAQVHSHSHSHAHAGAAAGHALGFGHTSHTSHAGHTHTSHGHHTGHAGHAGHGHGHGTHRTSTSRHASDTGTGTTSTSTSTPSTDAASGNAQHNTQHNIRARTCAPRPDEVYDTLQDLE